MDSSAEYPKPIHATGATPDQFWFVSHGIDRGTIIAVPKIMVATVVRIAPYLGRNRIDKALCQPQQAAAPINIKSPSQDGPNETSRELSNTMVATPSKDRMTPPRTPAANRSRFKRIPIR